MMIFVFHNALTALLLLEPTTASYCPTKTPDIAGLMVVYGFRSGNHSGSPSGSVRSRRKIIQGGQSDGFQLGTTLSKDGPCPFGIAMGNE